MEHIRLRELGVWTVPGLGDLCLDLEDLSLEYISLRTFGLEGTWLRAFENSSLEYTRLVGCGSGSEGLGLACTRPLGLAWADPSFEDLGLDYTTLQGFGHRFMGLAMELSLIHI